MSEEKSYEIVAEDVRLGALRVQGPDELLERAAAIAASLANLIRARGLALRIRNAEYVRVDGWAVMGAMLGIVPRERATRRLEDGSYEASVELIRVTDGAVVGAASAVCGMDEERWAKMPEYARRSMALTRAVGKAYRLGFSWIIALAGYEPTPAEEIVDIEPAGAGKAADKAAPDKAAPKPPDTTTAFWEYANRKRVSRDEALGYVQAAGNDFAKALADLKRMYP